MCIAESLPAAIQYQVVGGSWVRGRGGELVVTRGAGLSLDCVFRRGRGTPEWAWPVRGRGPGNSSGERDYITGWATADADKHWLYRLEVANISTEVNTGTFNQG